MTLQERQDQLGVMIEEYKDKKKTR